MNIIEICKGVWQFNETSNFSNVDAYLIVGEKRALLVDALMHEKTVYEKVRKLTQLPLDVVLTHGHGDHTGAGLKGLHENGCTIYMDLQVYPGHRSQSSVQLNLQYVSDIRDVTNGAISGEIDGESAEMEFLGVHLKYKYTSFGLVHDYLYDPEKIL